MVFRSHSLSVGDAIRESSRLTLILTPIWGDTGEVFARWESSAFKADDAESAELWLFVFPLIRECRTKHDLSELVHSALPQAYPVKPHSSL